MDITVHVNSEEEGMLISRVAKEMTGNNKLKQSIKNGKWEVFYNWVRETCADIWESIKGVVSKVWDTITGWF